MQVCLVRVCVLGPRHRMRRLGVKEPFVLLNRQLDFAAIQGLRGEIGT